jgi:hypothetical protein
MQILIDHSAGMEAKRIRLQDWQLPASVLWMQLKRPDPNAAQQLLAVELTFWECKPFPAPSK